MQGYNTRNSEYVYGFRYCDCSSHCQSEIVYDFTAVCEVVAEVYTTFWVTGSHIARWHVLLGDSAR